MSTLTEKTSTRTLTVCGSAKGLNAGLLAEPFAELAARLARKLATQNASLAGLADCR